MSSGSQPCSQKDRKESSLASGKKTGAPKQGSGQGGKAQRHHRNIAQNETVSCSCLPQKGIATGQRKLRASGLSLLRFSDSLKFAACICAGMSHMIQKAQ